MISCLTSRRPRRPLAAIIRASVVLGSLLAAMGVGPAAHAVTYVTVDDHPAPVTLVAGETITIRFDVSKASGTLQYRWARDVARIGTFDPIAPVWTFGPISDNGGLDIDPEPGKIAMKQSLPAIAVPSGPYLFYLEDNTDGSTITSTTWTVVPKPETQGFAGRVLMFLGGSQTGTPPPDAIIHAQSEGGKTVATATIQRDGSYQLPVPPGTYVLFSEWFGNLRSQRQILNLVEEQQRVGVDLALLPGQEVSGAVRDGASPMANTVVQATTAGGATITTKTFGDGTYTLVLPSGSHRVSARGITQDVAVSDGPTDGVDFPMPALAPTPATGGIVTIAGSGVGGFGGEGGPALRARLGFVRSLAMDRTGNLYTVDNTLHRVRKIDATTGIITTVAGSGPVERVRGLVFFGSTGGFSGDGGPATAARLDTPQHLAVDLAGNLYIGDTANNRVRRVDPSGLITTVAGSGATGLGRGGFSGDGGPATSATLNVTQAIALDRAGNLYVVDGRNNRVRRISPEGIITTVAGGGTDPVTDGALATAVALGQTRTLAVDGDGNLFIADLGLRIYKVDSAGRIRHLAGTGKAGFSGDGGPATEAQYSSSTPKMAVDLAGNLYFSDNDNHRIRKISPDGIIATVAGSGPAGTGAAAGGFGGDGGPATSALLSGPAHVAIDAAGNLLIADTGNGRIRMVVGVAAPGYIGGR